MSANRLTFSWIRAFGVRLRAHLNIHLVVFHLVNRGHLVDVDNLFIDHGLPPRLVSDLVGIFAVLFPHLW